MKYGEHLKQNIAAEYGPEPYLRYDKADEIITELSSTKPSRYVRLSASVFSMFGCCVITLMLRLSFWPCVCMDRFDRVS